MISARPPVIAGLCLAALAGSLIAGAQSMATQTASEPAPSEPAPSEPAPSEPAPSEPAPSEPATSEPAPSEPATPEPAPSEPAALIVLGVAQDGGVPQAGSPRPAWLPKGERRYATSIAVVDGERRYLFDATPDFPEQLELLDELAPTGRRAPALDGIFLTHAHIGHYVGLVHLGHEALGTRGVPVYAMPRMAEYLERDGPWSQLVAYGNIELRGLEENRPTAVSRLKVTPLRVPHREEFSEAVGFRIEGPTRSALYLSDIDSWEQWDERGMRLEAVLDSVDLAFVDATFFADGEIPGRDMSAFPHPRVVDTMQRLAPLPAAERAKVHFIHLNHTNPALDPNSEQRRQVEAAGFKVVARGDRFEL